MPGKKKKDEEGCGGAPQWMCTFSDMMSLLLCFFVLLFAMSTIEKVKFEQMINSIKGALGTIPEIYNTSWVEPVSVQPQKVEPVQRNRTLQRAKEAIVEKARSRLVSDEESKEIVIEGVKEGIRFTLTGRVLFASGMSTLSEEGKRNLRAVAETLNDFSELHIQITGHTDNTTISESLFHNNWRLAQARAFSVLTFLRDECNVSEKRMSFQSCGPYRPRFPNDTPEQQALNRRVEITLMQGSKAEVITGVLKGQEDPKIIPNESDFIPQ